MTKNVWCLEASEVKIYMVSFSFWGSSNRKKTWFPASQNSASVLGDQFVVVPCVSTVTNISFVFSVGFWFNSHLVSFSILNKSNWTHLGSIPRVHKLELPLSALEQKRLKKGNNKKERLCRRSGIVLGIVSHRLANLPSVGDDGFLQVNVAGWENSLQRRRQKKESDKEKTVSNHTVFGRADEDELYLATCASNKLK